MVRNSGNVIRPDCTNRETLREYLLRTCTVSTMAANQEDIRAIDVVEYERIWGFVLEIGTAERHFNSLQQTYRALASTWLLGSCAGAGFVFKEWHDPSSIERTVLLGSIGLLGGIGIVLLWVVDLLVYHRLLDAYFVEGLHLEEMYPWLPQVRSNMMRIHDGNGILSRIILFYVCSSGVLFLFSVIYVGYWIIAFRGAYSMAYLWAAGTISVVSCSEALLVRSTHKTAITLKKYSRR